MIIEILYWCGYIIGVHNAVMVYIGIPIVLALLIRRWIKRKQTEAEIKQKVLRF